MSDSSIYTLDDGSESDTGQKHTFIHPWRRTQSTSSIRKVEEDKTKRRVKTVSGMPAVKERYIPHTSAQEYLLIGESREEGVDPQIEFERLVKEMGEVFDVRVQLIAEINNESLA
jgi:hypothetical protein